MKKTRPQIRSQWQRFPGAVIDHSDEEKVTRESFAPMTQVKFIIDRFARTGILPSNHLEEFGNQTEATQFEQLVALRNIERSFLELSPEEQEKHGNARAWLMNTAKELHAATLPAEEEPETVQDAESPQAVQDEQS